jgi:hypothetical protein
MCSSAPTRSAILRMCARRFPLLHRVGADAGLHDQPASRQHGAMLRASGKCVGVAPVQAALGPRMRLDGRTIGPPRRRSGGPADEGQPLRGLDRMSRRGRQGRAQRKAEAGEVANQNSKPSIMLGIHSKCVFPARAARYRSHFDAVASELAGTGETDGNRQPRSGRRYEVSGLLTPRFWGVDGSGATATAFVFLA